ncbi:hypothetical protein B9Z19DRAFT_777791 [Tuber borchii]|uniref:Uncharacterized protein n=1 Tax=Tuber borchii TaxID=42251 RepID=A0A2T6ZWV7_TUBBO|nr:hypothetical protein B9Z19DRAFT_777791 [Tuber borchii]
MISGYLLRYREPGRKFRRNALTCQRERLHPLISAFHSILASYTPFLSFPFPVFLLLSHQTSATGQSTLPHHPPLLLVVTVLISFSYQ